MHQHSFELMTKFQIWKYVPRTSENKDQISQGEPLNGGMRSTGSKHEFLLC